VGYYSRQTKVLLHYAAYDRACDAMERWPTGQSRTVTPDDVVGSPGQFQDRRYEAFPRLPLLWALAALRIDPTRFTFVDYGAGRGRAVLTAARLPFAACVGVEFSQTLHAEACDNVAAYPMDRLACRTITVVNVNAADYTLPSGDLVLFFYNPFTAAVLDRVAEQIEAAARAEPRDIRVIYVNPRRSALFAGRPAFRPEVVPLRVRAKLALFGLGPIDFFTVSDVAPATDQAPASRVVAT